MLQKGVCMVSVTMCRLELERLLVQPRDSPEGCPTCSYNNSFFQNRVYCYKADLQPAIGIVVVRQPAEIERVERKEISMGF